MIVAKDEKARREALDKILPMQRKDFIDIFSVMKGYPVTIRLLDPPLREFLPQEKGEIKSLSESLEISEEELTDIIKGLHELNPMMGMRGCRLAVIYPEIAEMQTRAIIEAAIEVTKRGDTVIPEIMVPLICDVKEFKFVKDVIVRTADQILKGSRCCD